MVNEKIKQAASILEEMNIDLWLTFVRENETVPDPALELILGAGCTWASAFLIRPQGRPVAIVGSLDAQNIKDHADYQVITYLDSVKEDLLNYLKKTDPRRIAVNFSVNDPTADGLSHGMYLMLTEYLAGTPWLERLESSELLMATLRGRKSPEERKRIEKAIQVTLRIFDHVTAFVKPGHTEKQVRDFIREQLTSTGLEPAWDEDHCPAVFTGPDSAGAHAGPTDRHIEPGHLMNIDFGVRYRGYVSDLQRTWYFLRAGEPVAPGEVQHGFETIRIAIQKAAAALKPGVEGWTIDAVARDYITGAGYEEFPHGLGHQVGRKAHDGSALLCPRWDRYKKSPFLKTEIGQIYTLEPRLTVPGHGIATIEEIVVVTEDGCRFLSTPQEELYLISA